MKWLGRRAWLTVPGGGSHSAILPSFGYLNLQTGNSSRRNDTASLLQLWMAVQTPGASPLEKPEWIRLCQFRFGNAFWTTSKPSSHAMPIDIPYICPGLIAVTCSLSRLINTSSMLAMVPEFQPSR